jgi:K+-sensing histidine kinase KdpD
LLSVITPWVLMVVTILVLMVNLPGGEASGYARQAGLIAIFTVIALAFPVFLTQMELSAAHAVGMLALLALPEDAMGVSLWAIAIGSVIGAGALLALNPYAGRPMARRRRTLIYTVARTTITFSIGSAVYLNLDGPLPLERTAWDDATRTAVVLLMYMCVTVSVYLLLFVLELYTADARERNTLSGALRADLSQILVVLLLPVPFAVLSAELAEDFNTPTEVIGLMGLAIVIIGLHLLSRYEQQLRRQVEELRTLSVITRTMRAQLNLDALLRTIYLQVSQLLEADNFTVALHNLDTDQIEYPLVMRGGRQSDADAGHRPALYGDGLIDQVFRSGSPLLIPQNVAAAAAALDVKAPDERFTSWLGVPLVAGGRSLGVIAVMSSVQTHQFSRDNLRLLNIIAGSASIAIENAQLYHQQIERVENLATLNNIASLLSTTMSSGSAVETVISSVSMLSRGNAVALYLFSEYTETTPTRPLFVVHSAGLSDTFIDQPPLPLLISEQSTPLPMRMPVALPDVRIDARADTLREILARERKTALVEVPLVVGEKALGVMAIYYDQPQRFTGEKLELLRTFATQAAQAIQNARTYAITDEAFQRSVERLLVLAEIGRSLSSIIDLNEIAELLLRHTADISRVQVGVVAMLDAESRLTIAAQRGLESIDGISGDEPAWMQALEEGRAQQIANTERREDYHPLTPDARSAIIVPIMRADQPLGVIVLESSRPGGFAGDDTEFVQQIANQAVIAVENANLFARVSEARDRVQVILDTMEEAILLIDSRGRIALANPRLSLLGLDSATLIDRPVIDLLRWEELQMVERLGYESPNEIMAIVDDVQSPHDWNAYPSVIYDVHVGGATLYVERHVIPVEDQTGQVIGALLVFYNKTEERELEAAREQLSSMIVHDLRSPLTAVTTGLKLLRDVVPVDSDYRAIVETTTDASRRAIRKLLSRVDSLLDISRMESGRMALETDISELATLADNVSVELSPLAHELEVRIEAELDDHVPLLNIDADKVERVLLNLVDNAMKYAPAGSTVTMRAYPAGTRGAPKGFVRVEVADRGPGIPPEYKESLFERFVQVEGRQKVRRGVGLGLTFCKLVAEAHGGHIWIEDNPGGGSVFAFTLPIAPEFDLDELPTTFTDEDTEQQFNRFTGRE